MSVLEALALGKPVVVTDTNGLRNIITKGDAGSVVDDRLDSLIKAVDALLADGRQRERMAQNARMLAQREFGMASVAAQLGDLYAEVSVNGR
jgi:glycosyltransferase involved in cell wall biosynthesis